MKAPFPAFGGKSAVASLVWSRLGSVRNYVAPTYDGDPGLAYVYEEPFGNSLAIMLANPDYDWQDGRWLVDPVPIETVNDRDPYIVNAWRSLQADPAAVAKWADSPVNEADLHSRHAWLVGYVPMPDSIPAEFDTSDDMRAAFLAGWRASYKPFDPYAFWERLMTDPHYYDPKVAGWWIWGACCWIGSGWCSLEYGRHSGRSKNGGVNKKRPNAANMGINRKALNGPYHQRPHLQDGGKGINKTGLQPTRQRPDLSSRGRGAGATAKQIPYLSGHGQGVQTAGRRDDLYTYFVALSQRLRYVRICCGDWSRVTGKSVTWNNNCTRGKDAITAVVLDPPYSREAGRQDGLYAQDDLEVAHAVREWALSEGGNPKMRIALFGYEAEHGLHMPDSWECVAWETNGGYGNQNRGGNDNKREERIWFSPFCLRPDQEKETLPLLAMLRGE